MSKGRAWRILSDAKTELYSHFGLRPVDDYTGIAPIGWVRALLDVSDGSGGWRQTDKKPVITLNGILAYPALERRAEVLGQSPRQYRVRIETQFYLPLYRVHTDGIQFDAFPYNDTSPPQQHANLPADLILIPVTNYAFPSHIAVLRGEVLDANGATVSDALVTEQNRERAVTDSRGSFALPLRWVSSPGQTTIDVTHPLSGKVGAINIQLPQDLGKNQTITIS